MPAKFLTNDAEQNGLYLVDWMTSEYTHNPGIMAIPQASVSGEPTFVRLHAPYGYRVIRFEMVRVEAQPDYPLAVSDGSLGQLVHEEVQTATAGVLANMQSRVFAVRGIYVYALRSPVKSGQDLPYGIKACEQGSPGAGKILASKARRLF